MCPKELIIIITTFLNFRFQPRVCDGYHDLMQKAMSFNDVAVAIVKENDYKIYF